ncbi:hypothetical protein CAPTEDRAFT_94701, partial [Capitella teleta]
MIQLDNGGCVEFSMSDPEPIMGKSLLDLLGTFLHPVGKYYEPPLSMKGLSRIRHASAHHGAAIGFKRNQLAKFFVESTVLGLADFRAAALDFMVFGNAYFQIFTDYFGTIKRFQHLPALNIRRMRDTASGQSQYLQMGKNGVHVEFEPGEILHVMDYDTGQQFYGVPEWLSALQSILLNEDSTLFRRRYFANGCHIGYILYTTDPTIDPKVEKAIRDKVKQGKGVGNFQSVYINIPNGKDKGVQVIPVGDISQKDEFERIKNISADDTIVGHRLHPALAGLKPENAGGFGDIQK